MKVSIEREKGEVEGQLGQLGVLGVKQSEFPQTVSTLRDLHFDCAACTKSAPRGCPDLGARHFSCKLSHKIALVRCPCAFRLRRLPQSLRRGLLVCGLFIVNSLGSGDPAKFLSKMSLHDLAQLLNRRSCGDPGEILSKRSLHEDLVDAMS